MATDAESLAMRHALTLAQTAELPPGPNPRVAAVVLDADGAVRSTGCHLGAGTSHAEAAAIADAGAAAHGGTVVVTLEPCAHQGRTGPCTDALVDAGVRRVVFAQADPNPVAAGGAARLRAAGVDVEGGLLATEAEQVNAAWSFAMRHRRPFVTWKVATTLDGRVAAADGSSRWITGSAARADVHLLRGRCDTVLVGTGTVATDDPQLTVRDAKGVALPRRWQPLRAVMGTRPLDPSAAVLGDDADTCVLATRDPHAALATLFAAERRHVLLEGGPTLAAAFLRAGLVDEVVAYVAPALLGAGQPAVADLGIGTLNEGHRFELVDVTRLDDDVRLTLRPSTREATD